MTISEIQELEDGMHVDRLQGKLIKVFERESKTDKKNRPYTLQNGEVEDNGNSIRVSFWNHKDLTSYRGQVIVIRSVAPKSFVSVKHYKDKAQLSVPGQAIVLSESEESDDIPMDYPTTSIEGGDNQRKSVKINPPQANVEPRKVLAEEGTNVAYRAAMQFSNMMVIMISAATHSIKESGMEFEDASSKNDAILRLAITFFIQGKDKISGLPNTKPIYLKSKKEDVEASEPEHEIDTEIF